MQNTRAAAPALMFHHFCGEHHPRGQGAISADELATLIEHVGPGNILPAREWLSAFRGGTLQPQQTCLTFDDNLKCQLDVAVPVLEHYGLTGFWFVYTCYSTDRRLPRLEVYRYFRTVRFADIEDFYKEFFGLAAQLYGDEVTTWLARFDRLRFPMYPSFYSLNDCKFRQSRDALLGEERYFAVMDRMLANHGLDPDEIARAVLMSDDEIAKLHRRGHVVGLHSHTHPTDLARFAEDRQAWEYERNFAALETILGEKPTTMSHPCNSYDGSTLRLLDRLGIEVGFRADADQAAYSSLELPRRDHSVLIREVVQ
ncbi:Polysaccharide deacetylase [Bradyrhizobium sp. Ghvi]|uniref:polysaccharide deacetylase family protein n=1 Tax=Bradyrhizobium sp. Ghvi TaxID=1855319 RepID=UPI0008E64D73|nr:polysaccharide deacetylase family protein [Bradyrhizobium sp. Ghvi]SFP70356.1 Polysaccharide deacetylase [Bradyrhizobium sp. Ghvi]